MKTLIRVKPEPLRMGAEESDIDAGYRIFGKYYNHVVDCQISKSKDAIRVVSENVNPLDLKKCKSFDFKSILRFFFYKLVISDRAMRENLKIKNVKFLIRMKNYYPNSSFIAETSSMFALVSSVGGQIFTRSVNFEPVHSLSEIGFNLKGLLNFILKWPSAIIEKTMSKLFIISPMDFEQYNKLPFNGKMMILPLRQFLFDDLDEFINGEDNFAFLGSTFNVNHNLLGLRFILDEVFSNPALKDFSLNIYGSKVPPKLILDHVHNKKIVFRGWVKTLDEIYLKNNYFLAPYKGGTGAQSKVFEPLKRGKILICDPKLVYGWNLIEGKHYLPAISSKDFVDQILMCATNLDSQIEMKSNIKKWLFGNFSMLKYESQIINFMK